MPDGVLERWQNVIRISRTMEETMEIQRRSQLDEEGKLIKDNLKGAINRENQTERGIQENSDKERTRGRKIPGGGIKNERQYAPTGSKPALREPRTVRWEKKT